MPFDMGFDCRGSAGFVTDPSYGVPVLGETFPHTYTNGNGDSINGGWSSAPSVASHAASNDPRIAGINFYTADAPGISFTVDLSSGSAPGAGTYAIDFACGDQTDPSVCEFRVKDNTTTLIDATNGNTHYSLAAGHYIDATLTDVAASTTWTGTPVTKTFASTTAVFLLGAADVGFSVKVAHFRLTLQASTAAFPRMLMLLGVGV